MTTSTYTINAPGAKTLADARTLMIDGKPVTAEVTTDTITIFVGCAIVHTAPRPASINGSVASVAAYVIDILTNPAAVKIAAVAHSTDTIKVTVRANTDVSAKNFGRKAAAAARRIAGGRRIVRVWTGGAFLRGEQFYCYTYAVVNG